MKRRLYFLYRYLVTSRRWRRWVNARSMIFLVLAGSAVVFLALGLSTPRTTTAGIAVTLTPAAAQTADQSAGPARSTPLPPEYLVINPQSIGIVLAASMLVLIVIVGVLAFSGPNGESQG